MSLVITGNINTIKSTLSSFDQKFLHPDPEPSSCKFHYRLTVLLLFVFCLLVTSTFWIAGVQNKTFLNSIINANHTDYRSIFVLLLLMYYFIFQEMTASSTVCILGQFQKTLSTIIVTFKERLPYQSIIPKLNTLRIRKRGGMKHFHR